MIAYFLQKLFLYIEYPTIMYMFILQKVLSEKLKGNL